MVAGTVYSSNIMWFLKGSSCCKVVVVAAVASVGVVIYIGLAV